MQTVKNHDKAPQEQPSLFADFPHANGKANGKAHVEDHVKATAKKQGKSKKQRMSKKQGISVASPTKLKATRKTKTSGDHLAAAQVLAKKLRKARGGLRRDTRQQAGIAICQHLIALLQETEQTTHAGPRIC